MHQTYQTVREKLQKNDYKLTPQREIILQTFTDNTDQHLSAEDVYGLVKAKHPEIGLATIYRTLDLLAELQVLQKLNFGDGRSRYEFNDKEVHHHHHLICLGCGIVAEFSEDLLEKLEQAISNHNGFKITDHELKFYGYCHDCQK